MISFGWMVISAWMVITALEWPLKTALFPVVVGIPVFFMAMGELLHSLSKSKEIAKKKSAYGAQPSERQDQTLPAGRTLLAYTLIINLFLLTLFLGFLIGIPIFVFLYLKLYGRERWGISLGLTALAWVIFFGLFVRILAVPFPEGYLFRGLRALGIG